MIELIIEFLSDLFCEKRETTLAPTQPINISADADDADIAAWLAQFSREELFERTVGIDRGVAIPLAASDGQDFDFLPAHKRRFRKKTKQRLRWQRRSAQRAKTSARREKAQRRAAIAQRYGKDVRRDFAHKSSHALVTDPRVSLIVFEDLKTQNMTRRRRGKGRAAKSGLNRAILGSAWSQTRQFAAYKARRLHKLAIDVPPHFSSQECAACGCTHPGNRLSQSEFACHDCGHTENADRNASQVIARRGVDLILSGQWMPKEKRRANIRRKAEGRVGMIRTGSDPNARGEHVSRIGLTVGAQRSQNRETLATAPKAA